MLGPGFVQAAVAIAILLSVFVRSTRTGASWRAVDDGVATADHLRDLTGILTRAQLQETFGPPTTEGVYPVTRAEVRRERGGVGVLMGDRWLDGACAIVALVTLLPIWPIWGGRSVLELALTLAAGYQGAGWAATVLLVGKR
ncbi:hypothetical protein GC169_04410 [bacterium]|nr:hypothetical protein [bacterium]